MELFKINKRGVEYVFSDLTSLPEIHEFIKHRFIDWENSTFDIFESVKNPEKIAIDLGAWIGLTGIWLSRHFKEVICVEADKLSFDTLNNNLQSSLCTNVTLINKAIYKEKTTVVFGGNKYRNAPLNSSMSQIKNTATSHTDYICETITMYDLIHDYNLVGFIKVDIEGGEENIVEDLLNISTKYKIPTYISFHYTWWNNKNIGHFDFSGVRGFDESFKQIPDIISFIERNPFCSILFQP